MGDTVWLELTPELVYEDIHGGHRFSICKMDMQIEGEQDPGGTKVGSARKDRQGASKTHTDPMTCTWMAIVAKFSRIKPLFLFLPNFSMILERPILLQYKIHRKHSSCLFCLLTSSLL